MNVRETKEQLIAELVRLAFAEDIGDGDHTTLCCIPATEMGKSQLIVKEDGVLAGVEIAKQIFHTFDPALKMTEFIHDGAEVKKGDIAFVVEGKVQSLLQTERLMLCKPPMLILDEATSSIDTRTEIRIQKAFSRLMQGRTTFIVAHRLATIKEADIILVMRDGNIVEQGTHKDLLAKKGFYYELYNSQFPSVK